MIPSEYTENSCEACKALCNSMRGTGPHRPHAHLMLDFQRESMAIYRCNACGYGLIYNGLAPERKWQWGAVPTSSNAQRGGGGKGQSKSGTSTPRARKSGANRRRVHGISASRNTARAD